MITAALVGCGRMGSVHAQVLSTMGIQILSVADPHLTAAEQLVASLHLPYSVSIFPDLDHLLTSHIPDLLCIATTADSHYTIASQAISSSIRYILLEKPAFTSLSYCHKINTLLHGSHCSVAVNHQMRFLPQYQIPKSYLSSSSFGALSSMHVSAGNFGLAMNGTHYFEAFRFLTDEPPAEVSAWFDDQSLPNPRGAQFQDKSGCIRVTTVSGRRLYIDASADQGHGVFVTYMARNGRITVDELTGEMATVVRTSSSLDAPTTRYGMPVETFHTQIKPVELVNSTKDVLSALLSNHGYPTLEDASSSIKTLVAAYHSHRKGGILVHLKDIPDDDPEIFPWA